MFSKSAAALIAAFAITSAANAATVLSSSNTFAAPAGSSFITFNDTNGTAAEANRIGVDVAFNGLARRVDNSERVFAADGTGFDFNKPSFGDGSAFFGVAGSPASVTFTTRGVGMSSISLFAGSLDNYNRVDLLGLDGRTVLRTVTGNEMYGGNAPFPGSATDRNANKRVIFTGTEGSVYGGVRMYNIDGRGSFEFDQLAFSPAAVPEPATWAMMIGGFGLVGGMMRRRNRTLVSA